LIKFNRKNETNPQNPDLMPSEDDEAHEGAGDGPIKTSEPESMYPKLEEGCFIIFFDLLRLNFIKMMRRYSNLQNFSRLL
jgi:hypothetical protein